MRNRLLGACIIMAALSAEAQDLPNPFTPSDQPMIGPAPIPVMEQVFWVQLKLDPAAQVQVNAPEGVALLDRTKPGTRGLARAGYSRLYFRADRGIADGRIVITPAGGAPVSVPLTVRTYREDIEEQVKVVPGVDPSVRKAGRSYYTDDLIAIARENLERDPTLADDMHRTVRYDSMADEEIFAALPSWNVPRDMFGNFPCPVCGEKIYAKSGFYPWSAPLEARFRCKCPECGGLFPSNDWPADDFTSGDYPDDGWGFDIADNGNRTDFAAWIAYWNHHTLWQTVGSELRRLSLRYLLEDDQEAAHRCGILLARMAYVYPGMDMRWQQVDDLYIKKPGRLLPNGDWELKEILVPACEAYDAIWEYLGTDQALADFLHAKDESISEPDDVRALIDTYLIQVFGWDWLRREVRGGSVGGAEADLAYMAVCANMGKVSDRWIEELFTHAYSSGLNKGGFDDETLINTRTREGPVWIAALSYAVGTYMLSGSKMAEILSRVGSGEWGARCNLYDETLYPKWHATFDTWPLFEVAGQFYPHYGDTSAPPGYRFPNGIVQLLQREYVRAWRRWPTDEIARALVRVGEPKAELFEPYVWPEIAAQAEAAGPAPPLQSRVLDGVGFVFLESRADAEDLNQRAGIALRYGYGCGHHHSDNLNIEMWAHGQNLAPELGYPTWAHPMGATDHTVHHCTGMIDYALQYQGPICHGTLELYAGAPEASFADVSAQPTGFPNRVYRRMVCLADGPEGNVYLLDILRMAGGTTRTWCFHGPQQKDFESNLIFGPIESDPLPTTSGRGGPNVVQVQRATSDGDVFADWTHRDADLHLSMDLLGAQNRRYLTATFAKTDVPDIRFLFAEDEAEDGASEFVALWEPYTDAPFIERVERLPVEGWEGDAEFGPVAVRVTMVGGQVDTLIYSPDPEATLTAGSVTLRGSFGYWSEQDGRPRCAHLVNGTRLGDGRDEVTLAEAATVATITDVDLTGNLITLDEELAVGDALAGRMVFLTSQDGRHRTAYEIAEVLAPGNVVRLRHNSIIYRSKVDAFVEDGGHITCELPLALEAGRGFKPGYYDGALITGEDLTARYRVDRVEGENVFADRPLDPKDFPDADGDGRVVVSIFDHGPGDRAVVYNSLLQRWE